MDYENWLPQYRRLWNRDDPTFARKKEEIITIYNLVATAFKTEFIPIVFKSHNMNISRIDERRVILCDVHFFDIAQLIASSFYVSPMKDVKKLTDLLLANSFLCSDDVLTAYEYAQSFIGGPYTAAFVKPGSFDHKRIAYSRQMQVFFAIAHEMAHEKYQHPSGYHSLISKYVSKRIEELVEIQNGIAEQINNIDLSILKDKLNRTPFVDAFASPTPENYHKIMEAFVFFNRLYNQYSEQLHLPWETDRECREYFAIACENYLRNKKESIFEKERMIEESVCDVLALIELFNLQIPTMTRQDSVNHAVEAYVLCLLAQDMILSAINIQTDYMDVTKQHVDYIRMRLEKESLLFEDITALYESLFQSDEQIDWTEVKEKFIQANRIAELMYAEFVEDIISIDLDSVDEKYISAFDPQWKIIVSKAERFLTLPL